MTANITDPIPLFINITQRDLLIHMLITAFAEPEAILSEIFLFSRQLSTMTLNSIRPLSSQSFQFNPCS